MENINKNQIIFLLVLALGVSVYLNFQKEGNSIFENNLKCSLFIKQESDKIIEISKLKINEESTVTTPIVFFSPKLNTCVSAYSVRSNNTDGFDAFYIDDLLSGDQIFSDGGFAKDMVEGVSLPEIANKNFEEKIEELRTR